MDWLNKSGAEYHKLELKILSEDNRAIFATKKIFKDEMIMKIPQSKLITFEMAKNSPAGKKLLGSYKSLNSSTNSYFAVFLLQEKSKENSDWKPFLDILLQSYENFPIFFTEEERKELEGSPFLEKIDDSKKKLELDYNLIIQSAPEMKKFSLKEFSEMKISADSRIFGVTIHGLSTTVFAPLADMLNHKSISPTFWEYSDNLNSFVIRALGNINQGEEVFFNYKNL